MSCEALQSIQKNCSNNTGGIKNVWVNQQDEISAVTVSAGAWIVSAITVGDPCVPFAINRNTGNYTEETAQDLLSGSTVVTQTITLMFNRRDKEKSEAINVLGSGQQYLAVVIQDANDKYWYFENVQLTATGEGSGTARADGSKYSITLLAETDHLAYEVTNTLITSNPTDFPPAVQS
jgi:hypothetical protein